MNGKEKRQIGLVYYFMYDHLKNKAVENILGKKEAVTLIGRFYHIKKNYSYVVLKELENLGLITNINRSSIFVNDVGLKLDTPNILFRKVGLF